MKVMPPKKCLMKEGDYGLRKLAGKTNPQNTPGCVLITFYMVCYKLTNIFVRIVK